MEEWVRGGRRRRRLDREQVQAFHIAPHNASGIGAGWTRGAICAISGERRRNKGREMKAKT
jgi:hypothetical protein